MTDTAIISDPYRQPITVQQHRDGGVVLRGSRPGCILLLSEAELERVFRFAQGLGVLQRFQMAPKSPQSDEEFTQRSLGS
jgi:hypothetical protein